MVSEDQVPLSICCCNVSCRQCIVVRCFVCGYYDGILIETAKFSDNIRVTENGIVSGVERVLKSTNMLRIRTSGNHMIRSK